MMLYEISVPVKSTPILGQAYKDVTGELLIYLGQNNGDYDSWACILKDRVILCGDSYPDEPLTELTPTELVKILLNM